MKHNLGLVALLLMVAAAAATAQTSTGRHRVEPEAEEPDKATESADDTRFFITVGAGMATGGDLFRIRTAGNSGIRYVPAAGEPFASENVLITLDEALALAAGFGGRIGSHLWYRLDASTATIDVAAEARIGEGAQAYRWDRLSFVHVAAGLEYRLVSAPSFPYVTAGVGLMSITADTDEQFDQTQPSLRAGAGYQLTFTREWSLRVEIRDSIASLDFEDYTPPVVGSQLPDFTLEDKGPTHAFELVLQLAGSF